MSASYVLRILSDAVAEMRDDQRIYFASRSPADLRKAIKSEAKVDKILNLIKGGVVSLVDVDGNRFNAEFQGSDLWLITHCD
jgi:hypothetical protein